MFIPSGNKAEIMHRKLAKENNDARERDAGCWLVAWSVGRSVGWMCVCDVSAIYMYVHDDNTPLCVLMLGSTQLARLHLFSLTHSK